MLYNTYIAKTDADKITDNKIRITQNSCEYFNSHLSHPTSHAISSSQYGIVHLVKSMGKVVTLSRFGLDTDIVSGGSRRNAHLTSVEVSLFLRHVFPQLFIRSQGGKWTAFTAVCI